MKKPLRGKPVPKAKTHHHAKPVPVTRAVRTARHSAAVKAAKTRAANAKKAKVHPRRKLALGEGVACCSAEALAASLRLAGVPVSDEDVLALYWRTAADPDTGASILATLEAAAAWGLAGCCPLDAVPVITGAVMDAPQVADAHAGVLEQAGCWPGVRRPEAPFVAGMLAPACGDAVVLHPFQLLPDLGGGAADPRGQLPGSEPRAITRPVGGDQLADGRLAHAVILGVDLPGPHAVLATPDGWWSWGELYDPACWPDAVIEEAWTIEWEV